MAVISVRVGDKWIKGVESVELPPIQFEERNAAAGALWPNAIKLRTTAARITLENGDVLWTEGDRSWWHRCADCGGPIGEDHGPRDGWQLEDGRTVCHACCVRDTRSGTRSISELVRLIAQQENHGQEENPA